MEAFLRRGIPELDAHGFHRTGTLDFVVLLDKGEVRLEPGDVVVQRDRNHAWRAGELVPDAASTQARICTREQVHRIKLRAQIKAKRYRWAVHLNTNQSRAGRPDASQRQIALSPAFAHGRNGPSALGRMVFKAPSRTADDDLTRDADEPREIGCDQIACRRTV